MPMVLINPEFEPVGDETVEGPEGCLSIPGIYADVSRFAVVRGRGLDLGGNAVEFEAEGLLSRALQHEIDHLDGVLFIDKLDVEERRRVAKGLQEMSGGMLG